MVSARESFPASLTTIRPLSTMTCYCEYCGNRASDIRTLTVASCSRHPAGHHKGRHSLYQGDNAAPCTCRYCGQRATDIRTLTASTCTRHPEGYHAGRHSPAL